MLSAAAGPPATSSAPAHGAVVPTKPGPAARSRGRKTHCRAEERKCKKAQRAPRPALLAEISLLALGMSAVPGVKANAAAGQPVPRDCSPSASCGIWHSDRRQGKLLNITLTHKLSSSDWERTGRQQLTHTPDFSLMPLPFSSFQSCQSCRGAQSTACTARRRRLHAFRPCSPLPPNTSKPGPARPRLLPSCEFLELPAPRASPPKKGESHAKPEMAESL